MNGIVVRAGTPEDWPSIWPIVEAVVRAGDTYTYPRDLTSEQARHLWMPDAPAITFIATEDDLILGTAKVGANQLGGGAHMATASFMVAPAARGRGVGRLLGERAMTWARDQGFRAMQFNAVVEANLAAVALWKSLGFEIVGIVPEAFDHPTQGLVGLYVMHRKL